MKMPTLNFEELKRCKQTYNGLSYEGFLLNVANSYWNETITKKEKDFLLQSNNLEG